jgi:hypothetical protein
MITRYHYNYKVKSKFINSDKKSLIKEGVKEDEWGLLQVMQYVIQ